MKIYGLLGKNISYSLSPTVHNAAFRALGMNAEYKIFDITRDKLEGFFSRLKEGTVSGCNVTVPYKEEALRFVQKCGDLAENIGAVNTIVPEGSSLCGYNTDYQGFIGALDGKSTGDLNFNPEGKDVFMFGAGGSAKAVIYALMSLRARRIAIADIDVDKAERLASSVIDKHIGNSLITVVKDETKYEEFISKAELLVNATPCGTKKSDPGLFDYRYIHEKLYVFDLIYASPTPLLAEARLRGAGAVNGLNMLLYQASKAFTIWTGKVAPLDAMREALIGEMK